MSGRRPWWKDVDWYPMPDPLRHLWVSGPERELSQEPLPETAFQVAELGRPEGLKGVRDQKDESYLTLIQGEIPTEVMTVVFRYILKNWSQP